MDTLDIILNNFGGDRSNRQYQEMRAALCDLECECGYKIKPYRRGGHSARKNQKESASSKKFNCDVTNALLNHVNYPTFSFLGDKNEQSPVYYNEDGELRTHWCLLVEISEILKEKASSIGIRGFSSYNERVEVFFTRDKDDHDSDSHQFKFPYTFSWSDLKVGNTIAILYAERETKNNGDWTGIIQTDLDSVYIFRTSINEVISEANLLLDDADSMHRKDKLLCYGCLVRTNELKACSKCKLAKYCHRICQEKAWRLRHKVLCEQSEILLRLSCLPRQTKLDNFFTFNLNDENCLPPYVYSAKHVQKAYNEFPTEDTKCGLCGLNNQQSFAKNGLPLCKTDCCSNWICDDSHQYKMGSFVTNSCFRNHNKYTLCGHHFNEEHGSRSWKQCKKCQIDYRLNKILYEDYGTNKYNFTKLDSIEKKKIECIKCGFTSTELNDFIGLKRRMRFNLNDYYCKKVDCKRAGGFENHSDNSAFLVVTETK